jgi:hypothetical protein
LYVFENYLKGSKIPEAEWVLHAQPLLSGTALATWVAVAKSTPDTLSWSVFRSTMLDAFAYQDAALQARKKLHQIKQGPSQSAVDYVCDFKLLLAQVGSPAPAESDKILWLHNGLNDRLKSATLVDQKTGSFWKSFEALAQFLVALSPSLSATKATSAPAASFAARPRFSRVNVMKTQAKAKGKPRQPPPWQQPAQKQSKAKSFFRDLPLAEQLKRNEQQRSALMARLQQEKGNPK